MHTGNRGGHGPCLFCIDSGKHGRKHATLSSTFIVRGPVQRMQLAGVCFHAFNPGTAHTLHMARSARQKKKKKKDKIPQCSPTNARGIYSQFYISSFFSTSIAE